VLFGSYLFSLAFEKPFLTYRSFRDLRARLRSLTGKAPSNSEPPAHDVSSARRERAGAAV
jgi:hypothetical protein